MRKTSAQKISEDLYEFSDWRGRKYEAVRGHEDNSNQAQDMEKARRSLDNYIETGVYTAPRPNYFPTPKDPPPGWRWFIYSGDEFFGSYMSPYAAEDVFNAKVVHVDGILS